MLTKTYSASILAIEAIPVTIEVIAQKGVGFTIVGLPDAAVKESYQRIIAALEQCNVGWKHRRIVVNLSPADIKKEGAGFDLPMAIGMLAANELIPAENLADCMLIGELSLDGSVLPVKGVLPIAVLARKLGFKKLIVPVDNITEAAVVNRIDVYGVSNLREAIDAVTGAGELQPTRIDTRRIFEEQSQEFDFDFAEVKGQETVKRAFEVACAGGHNILMVGPPGAGKSMMAKRLPSILPPLNMAEALETTKIHSVAGKLSKGSMLMTTRPFRTPHHTVSPVALVGGGANPMPGEISLAHNGVLFLDEFPEFPRQVLEVMRQPIEDRVITVSRAKYTVDYPASFMLVASMNPCPCGYYGHPARRCTCMPNQVQKYMNKISGPLMDRIDIQVEIEPVEFDDMANRAPAEPSSAIRARVMAAREIQQARFRDLPGIHCNAQMSGKQLQKYAWPDEAGLKKLKDRMTRLNMSARAFDRILRVARTIADLESALSLPPRFNPMDLPPQNASDNPEGSSTQYGNNISREYVEALATAVKAPVEARHIAEAIGYRALDRPSNFGVAF